MALTPVETVTLYHVKPPEVMDIVRELRSAKLTQGIDFDFRYSHASFDNTSYEAVEPSKAEFYFYQAKWATWFTLKYV